MLHPASCARTSSNLSPVCAGELVSVNMYQPVLPWPVVGPVELDGVEEELRVQQVERSCMARRGAVAVGGFERRARG